MVENIVRIRKYSIKKEKADAKIYHKCLISIHKVFFYGYTKSEKGNYRSGIVYAYECELTKEDISKVQKEVADLLSQESFPEYKSVWSSNKEIARPEEFGYDDSYTQYCDGVVGYDAIRKYIEETQHQITDILNKDDVLLNALQIWAKLQPAGFDTYYSPYKINPTKEERHKTIASRVKASKIRQTLSFLNHLHCLLIAKEPEIRELYQSYIDKGISFYNQTQTMDR